MMMKQSKQDIINKVETLMGEIQKLGKKELDRSYYEDLCQEATEWVEELRNNEVELLQ